MAFQEPASTLIESVGPEDDVRLGNMGIDELSGAGRVGDVTDVDGLPAGSEQNDGVCPNSCTSPSNEIAQLFTSGQNAGKRIALRDRHRRAQIYELPL